MLADVSFISIRAAIGLAFLAFFEMNNVLIKLIMLNPQIITHVIMWVNKKLINDECHDDH